MINLVNERFNALKLIIEDIKNKKMVIELLNILLNVELKNFEYKGIKKLEKISEYDFSLLKLVGKTDNKEFEIYTRIIRGGEIKKSVFCCWSLLQEEYEAQMPNNSKNKIIDKVTIKEKRNEAYKNSVCLAQESHINYDFEVNFINFIKLIKQNNPILNKWIEYINLDEKDILLIMVKDIY